MSVSIWEGKKAEDLIAAISGLGQPDGIPETVKAALLNCFQNVAWINNNGQTYYNALYSALYNQVIWDYEWDASSGTNPPDMTGVSFDFSTEPGALKVVMPNLTKNFESNAFEARIVCKFPLIAQSNNPKINLYSYISDTDNVAVSIQPNATTNVTSDQNKIAFVTNWDSTTKEFTSYDQTTYREYHIICKDGVIKVYFDGTLVKSFAKIDSSSHVSATSFKIVCGTTTTYNMFIKSIKIREL